MPRVDLGKVVGDQGPQGVPGPGVPNGGDTGQILAKKSGTNLDTEWIDPPETGVTSFNGRTGAVEPQARDYTPDLIGAVPNTRTIDGKALSSDISILPTGGSAGQILSKNSSTNYDTKWIDAPSGGGSVELPLSISNGGTGAKTAAGAMKAISNINNLAVGMVATSTGTGSTALGYSANASDSFSVALGGFAKAAGCSTALGYSATASGSDSTALGHLSNAYRSSSTSVGYSAKAIGDYSTALGGSTNASGNYSTALGYGAYTYTANNIQLGNPSSLESITARVNIAVGSDERDKTDITPIKDGAVEFLNKIKAIQYVFNHREMYIAPEDELSEEDKNNKHKYGMCTYDKEAHARGDKKGERLRVGVSAQETQAALEAVYGSADYANIVNDNFHDYDKSTIPDGVENQLTVNYTGFIPFLIKAVQELSGRIEELERGMEGLVEILENHIEG